MGRHKWRRRLILLVILIIVGVVVLDPSRKAENHIADAAAGREIHSGGKAGDVPPASCRAAV